MWPSFDPWVLALGPAVALVACLPAARVDAPTEPAEPVPAVEAETSAARYARVSGPLLLYADPSTTAQHLELEPASASARVVEVLERRDGWCRVRTVLPRQAMGLGLEASMGLAVLDLEGWVEAARLLELAPASDSPGPASATSESSAKPAPTGSLRPVLMVRAGTRLRWPDGRVAGQAAEDHYFFTPPTVRTSETPEGTLELRCHQQRTAPGVGVVKGWLCVSTEELGERVDLEHAVALDVTARVFKTAEPSAGVQGALDRDIIRRIVRAHLAEVRACYNEGLAVDPQLAGRVAIDFVIAGTGYVSSALVADDTLADPAVGQCIAKAVSTWQFPKPRGGGNVIVTYPFNLSPG